MPFKLGGEIPKGHVKLPAPLTSDYLIASSAVALPDFEDRLEDNSGGWSSSASGDGGSATVGSTSDKYEGNASLYLYKTKSSGFLYAGSIQVSRTVDLTNINYLVFYYKTYYSNAGSSKLELLINGTSVTTLSASSSWKKQIVDVSSYSGSVTLSFKLSWPEVDSTSAHYAKAWIDWLQGYSELPDNAIDNNTSTLWHPSSTTKGTWIYIDLGAPTIVGGARVYWGSNVPNAYRIQASTDATNWWDVYKATSPPTPNSWMEYSWYATYARYLRIYFDDPGSNPPGVGEFHYYSRITDRVAAEHGHGSGVEPWRKGVFTSAFLKALERGKVPPRVAPIRGFTKRGELEVKIRNARKKGSKLTKQEIVDLIEALKEYVDFKMLD